MKYEELVTIVKESAKKTKVSKIVGHVAYQFNVEGEAEGAFYLEISDGKVYVEPYEYYDRDMIIVTTAEVIVQIVEGNMRPKDAYTKELLKIQGDIELLDVLPFGGK